MSRNKGIAQSDRTRTLRHLHELIAALDRRVPHVERTGEIEIAREGRALRERALRRIAELEAPGDQRQRSSGHNDLLSKDVVAPQADVVGRQRRRHRS
jgi:hypothetical protein